MQLKINCNLRVSFVILLAVTRELYVEFLLRLSLETITAMENENVDFFIIVRFHMTSWWSYVSQNNETVAMFISQTSPVEREAKKYRNKICIKNYLIH